MPVHSLGGKLLAKEEKSSLYSVRRARGKGKKSLWRAGAVSTADPALLVNQKIHRPWLLDPN
jgi:hypothetical protein